MTRSVVDASVAAKWLLFDERSKAADDALAMVVSDGASVPAIFPFEVENILIVAERRGRIGVEAREAALELMQALDVRLRHVLRFVVDERLAKYSMQQVGNATHRD